MGSGKTTVGALVAEKISRPFANLDTEIMVHTGRTIPELFEAGEERFREMEAMMLAVLAEREPAVISTGGGSILRPTNVEIMKRTGKLVLLTASVQEIVARIGEDDNRPLAGNTQALSELADTRVAAYRIAADVAVATDERTPDEVAMEVVACIAM